jgi:hypothetical protein
MVALGLRRLTVMQAASSKWATTQQVTLAAFARLNRNQQTMQPLAD